MDFLHRIDAVLAANQGKLVEAGIVAKLHRTECEGIPVVVMVGENASGKSLITKLLRHSCGKSDEVRAPHFSECISISMSSRAGGGMTGSIMYGHANDRNNSSGMTSLNPVNAAFNSAGGREHRVCLIFDELEVCLGEQYHYALAQLLHKRYQESLNGKQHVDGLLVITHSKEMVKGLMDCFTDRISFVGVGRAARLTLAEWVAEPTSRRSLEDLLQLRDEATARRRKVTEVFN